MSGVPSTDGRSVALGCGSGTDTQGAHVAVLDIANARATDTVLPAGHAHVWWDTSSTLHASTVRATGTATYWVLESGRWSLDEGQTAALRVFPTSGPSLRWTPSGTGDEGTWVAESDPEVDLGTGQGTPVYGLGAANIVAR